MPLIFKNVKARKTAMLSRLLCFFSIFTFSVCSAQMNHSLIVLKSGDSLNGFGKLKLRTFKYESYSRLDKREIDFSQIRLVKIKKTDTLTEIYRFFQDADSEDFIAALELVTGSHVELYSTLVNTNNGYTGTQTTNYWVKKPSDEKLTNLGAFNPLSTTLRGKVLNYFSDCKALIDKVENKDFRMRSGLEQIAVFYNENCNSN